MRLTSYKYCLIVIVVLVSTMLTGNLLLQFSQQHDSHPRLIPDQAMTVFVDPKPLREFVLINQNSQPFNLLSLNGQWSFLFFGFTHCPDICPTTLTTLSKLREQMTKGDSGTKNIQLIFISVDPKRDTAVKLKQYTTYFDPSIIGVTGTDLQLHKLTKQLDATFEIEDTLSKTSYQVYHTSAVFLINPQGQFEALLTPPFDIDTISRRFTVLKKIDAIKLLQQNKSL